MGYAGGLVVELVRTARATGDTAELLVYGDWLEEHGDAPRGQLVHLQCELAKTDRLARRALELRWEVDALIAEHGERFRAELPRLDGIEWTDFEYGHAAAVRVRNLESLHVHADAIAAAAPVVRAEIMDASETPIPAPDLSWIRTLRVHVTGANEVGVGTLLATCTAIEVVASRYDDDFPWLVRDAKVLERLTIEGSTDVGQDFVTAVTGRPWAKQLRSVELASHYVAYDDGYGNVDPRIGESGGAQLGKLSKLERVKLDRQRVGAGGLRKLVAALKQLTSLSVRECGWKKPSFGTGAPILELDLSQTALGTEGVHELASSPRLAAVQDLVLDTCEIESLGVAELVAAPLWQTLRRLELSRNPLGASAIRALAAAARPAQLHTLALADADLDDQAGAALAKVAWLGELTSLDLSGNILGRGCAGLRGIAGEHLRVLRLAAVGLERAEAAALARFWPRLVELDVSNNAIGDAGLERFVTMKEASALQTLALHDCKVTDDGLELLAARARCPRLRALDLAGNELGAGLLPLLGSGFLARIETLVLARCNVPRDVVLALAKTELPPRLSQLDLRGNVLDQATLVALADSPTLRAVPTILLDGEPWAFPDAIRTKLADRFGATWYQHDRT